MDYLVYKMSMIYLILSHIRRFLFGPPYAGLNCFLLIMRGLVVEETEPSLALGHPSSNPRVWFGVKAFHPVIHLENGPL